MHRTITKWEIFIPASEAGALNKTLTVEAINWMDALNAGLAQLGQAGTATSNVMLDIKDGAFHVTDIQYHRVFEVRPLSTRQVESGAEHRYTPPPPRAARSSSPPQDISTAKTEPRSRPLGKGAQLSSTQQKRAGQAARRSDATTEKREHRAAPKPRVDTPSPQRTKPVVDSDLLETQRMLRDKRPMGRFALDNATASEAISRADTEKTVGVPDIGFDAPTPPPPVVAEPAWTEVPAQGDIVAHRIFFVRDDDPGENSRLTYRERLIAGPPGTTRDEAARLLTHYFKQLKKSIKSAPRGKFINLAVFDHVFRERAERPAIAALDWKDWKREPNISFPLETPSVVETSHIPGVERQRAVPRPSDVDPPPSAPAAPMVATALEQTPTFIELTPPMQVMQAPGPEPQASRSDQLARDDGDRAITGRYGRPDRSPTEPAHDRAVDHGHGLGADGRQPWRGKPEQPQRQVGGVMPAPPPPPSVELDIGRHSAPPDLNEILVEVFEAMQDLYFVKTIQEAITFAVDLLASKIPCDSIVGLSKIPDEPGAMRCVAARGAGSGSLAGQKISAVKGTLLGLAVKQEISICVSDAQNDSRIRSEIDHLVTKDTRSALCSPFIFEGRAFGAVVLVNRSGGDSWQQGEVHIVSYVASHLAEYIAQSLETHEDFDAHFVRTTETAQQAAPPPTAPAARPVATAPQPAKAPAPQAQKNAPASAKKKQQRKKR